MKVQVWCEVVEQFNLSLTIKMEKTSLNGLVNLTRGRSFQSIGLKLGGLVKLNKIMKSYFGVTNREKLVYKIRSFQSKKPKLGD